MTKNNQPIPPQLLTSCEQAWCTPATFWSSPELLGFSQVWGWFTTETNSLSKRSTSRRKVVALTPPSRLFLLPQLISKHQIILDIAFTLLMKWEVFRGGSMLSHLLLHWNNSTYSRTIHLSQYLQHCPIFINFICFPENLISGATTWEAFPGS